MSTAPVARIKSANLRQAYDLALAGAIGALVGLYLYVELVDSPAIWVCDALAEVMPNHCQAALKGQDFTIRSLE